MKANRSAKRALSRFTIFKIIALQTIYYDGRTLHKIPGGGFEGRITSAESQYLKRFGSSGTNPSTAADRVCAELASESEK